MKTLTCDICGTHVEKAETNKEVMDQMWAHFKSAHPTEADAMMVKPQDDQDAGMAAAEAKIQDVQEEVKEESAA